MRDKILENGDMELSITCREQRELRALKRESPDTFDSDNFMYDYLEDLTSNSELEWIRPEYIGALTSAPILGIHGEDRPLQEGEDSDLLHVVGAWEDDAGVRQTWVQDVLGAWAWMSYQVESLQGELLANRKAILTKG